MGMPVVKPVVFHWYTSGKASGIPVEYQWHSVECWQNLPVVKPVVSHWYTSGKASGIPVAFSGIPADFTSGIPVEYQW